MTDDSPKSEVRRSEVYDTSGNGLAIGPREFRNIYRELIDENPLAVRAVLKILAVEFTGAVPTLAVTCDTRPRLLVNLGFVNEHCETEMEAKAVICHEFLHVLLRHTDRLAPVTPDEHLALDAVINAIIHRTLGTPASAFMSRYYKNARGPYRLLRPPTEAWYEPNDPISSASWNLYHGRLVADDIRDLARDLSNARPELDAPRLLGNHGDVPYGYDGTLGGDAAPGAEALRDALDAALKTMNGSGVFRAPRGPGLGAEAYEAVFRPADARVERWRRSVYDVLRRHLAPDAASLARDPVPRDFVLPVLSPRDRRAALRALWSPFVPEALWNTEVPRRQGSAHVYLDVSGSMHAEMPHIVALLGQLVRLIRRPFWAFSTKVAPARIERGQLLADTTGGTSMACVLAHLARTKPPAAVVVTDGYIETLTKGQVAAASATRLHVIITRDGSPMEIRKAGLAYTQLGALPQGCGLKAAG